MGLRAYYEAKKNGNDAGAISEYKDTLTKHLTDNYADIIKYDEDTDSYTAIKTSTIYNLEEEYKSSAVVELSENSRNKIDDQVEDKYGQNVDSISKQEFVSILEKAANGDKDAEELAALILRAKLSDSVDANGYIHEFELLDYDVLTHEGLSGVITNDIISGLPLGHPNGDSGKFDLEHYVTLVKADKDNYTNKLELNSVGNLFNSLY
jgi:hypothetical protein